MQTPLSLHIAAEKALPLQTISNFHVSAGSNGAQLASLEALISAEAVPDLALHGDTDEGEVRGPLRVAGISVLDLVVEYPHNTAQSPIFWVITANAWYKLLQPTVSYASSFATMQRKVQLAATALRLLAEQQVAVAGGGGAAVPTAEAEQLVKRAVEGTPEVAGAEEKELKAAVAFALAQVEGRLGRPKLSIHGKPVGR
jgi:hypothetical protein